MFYLLYILGAGYCTYGLLHSKHMLEPGCYHCLLFLTIEMGTLKTLMIVIFETNRINF